MTEQPLPKPQTDLPAPEQPVVVKNETPEHHGKSPILKFLLLSVIVAMILAAIGGAYVLGKNSVYKELNPTAPTIPPADPDVYEPTPDPTADWQTYEASNIDKTGPVRFTLKYPQTCSISKSNNILPNLEVISCPDLKIEINPEAGGRGAEVISKSEIQLGGYMWNKTEFKSGSKSNSRGVTYALTIDKEYYLIEINYEDYIAPTEDIVEEILSTFQVTDPNSFAEGSSCGPNAGQAGNEKCPSGFTCKNIDSYGIGSCTKN